MVEPVQRTYSVHSVKTVKLKGRYEIVDITAQLTSIQVSEEPNTEIVSRLIECELLPNKQLQVKGSLQDLLIECPEKKEPLLFLILND